MMAPDPRLVRAWRNRNLVPVIGAGFGKAVAELPNWRELLAAGIRFVEDRKGELSVSSEMLAGLHSLLESGQLTVGFSSLQKLLAGSLHTDFFRSELYEVFLTEQFQSPQIRSPRLLNALRQLEPRVVVTTNCDLLLAESNVVPHGSVVTWLEPEKMLAVIRSGSGFIHLHGRFDVPESVVLSESDYTRVAAEHGVRDSVTRALFHGGVLVFIGCSIDGAEDPHLSRFLSSFSEMISPLDSNSVPHFLLLPGKPEAKDRVRLRRLGIEPISYGEHFSELPTYLEAISQSSDDRKVVADLTRTLRAVRYSESLSEVFQNLKEFVDEVVFPGRKVRIGFAERVSEHGRSLLRSSHLIPTSATHNHFSYPQTLAAWALIEGRIFAWPDDLHRACDFPRLRRLGKLERVLELLRKTDPAVDPILPQFLDAAKIVQRSELATLTLEDLYQHWVGQQERPHYRQFVSVPVPVIDQIANGVDWPEFGVFNIDTPEKEPPLLNPRTEALLKFVSDLASLAFRLNHLQ